MSAESLPILTFYGADGCGKTTLATMVHEARTLLGDDCLMIGSSDYPDWLNPRLFTKFIGSTEHLDAGTASNASAEDRTKLFEDLAICLYGLASEHAANRGPVIVHSDPYLKRMVWAKINLNEDRFWEYAQQFDAYTSDHIGNSFASRVASILTTPQESFDRIVSRGIVDVYDPDTPEANIQLNNAVEFVRERMLGDVRPFERLLNCTVLHLENPGVNPNDLPQRLHQIAGKILAFNFEEAEWSA